MNCSSTEELFERFLDADVSPAERGRVLEHIDRCSACREILEELRVVDALLLQPRQVELAPNFTFAMMAEARALPVPKAYRPPIRAYVVSYLAAAWMTAGAIFWLAPQTMHGAAGALIDVARSIADAVGGLGSGVSRALAHGGSLITAILGALLALDVTVALGFGVALRFARPRLAERLRS